MGGKVIKVPNQLLITDMGVAGDFTVDRQQVFDPGQQQRRLFVPENRLQRCVYQTEKLSQVILATVRLAALAVEDGRLFAASFARGRMDLRAAIRPAVVQCLFWLRVRM